MIAVLNLQMQDSGYVAVDHQDRNLNLTFNHLHKRVPIHQPHRAESGKRQQHHPCIGPVLTRAAPRDMWPFESKSTYCRDKSGVQMHVLHTHMHPRLQSGQFA